MSNRRDLERLRCPKCNGTIARKFSLFEKVGLLFPINFRSYCYYECAKECYTYRGPRGLGSFMLSIPSTIALACIGGWHTRIMVGVGVTLAWVLLTSFMNPFLRRADNLAETNTVLAGAVMGGLWTFAIRVNGWSIGLDPGIMILAGCSAGVCIFFLDQDTIRPNSLIVIKQHDGSDGNSEH